MAKPFDPIRAYWKFRPSYVTHRDGKQEMVSVFCETSDQNFYCFRYPFQAYDIGREINPKYVRRPRILETLYIWLGLKAIKHFPRWIKL